MGFRRGASRMLAVTSMATASLLAVPAGAAPVPPGPVHVSPAPGAPGRTVGPAPARDGEERLWLLGGLVTALAATGLVARAALRDRTDL
ncbi:MULTISPECIES: hypothetical protein [unclassified Streptomyces]|uniref:hypothetical protein n=1 Tax=unclassified Streptomyces TaxID=2593676 RepID=UPI00363D2E8C